MMLHRPVQYNNNKVFNHHPHQYIVIDLSNTVADAELSGTDSGGCLILESYHMNNCSTPIPYVQFEQLNGTSTNFSNSTQLVSGVPLINNGTGTITTTYPQVPIIVSHSVPRSIQRFIVRLLSQDGTTVTVTRCILILRMMPSMDAYPTPNQNNMLQMEALKAHGQ